ncbi:hypothetical protein [Olivibacter sp. XZL3]|uniref:hypothetical protein n=1 Tax=Olivibacter sp. XZL3 TaxID=1735116 RepID=UPI001064A393|nr:hypothetical protein [Olivibacter sp. XZL3]
MSRCLICLWSAAGLLWSCNTAKFKTKLSAQEVLSVKRNAAISEVNGRSFVSADSSTYDVLWWLKGDAQWHPDSGMTADELLVRYRGKDWRNAMLLDSGQRMYETRDMLQQAAGTQVQEKQKEQKNWFHLPWWVFVVLIPGGYYLLKRFYR